MTKIIEEDNKEDSSHHSCHEQAEYENKKKIIVRQIKMINIKKFRNLYPDLSKLSNGQISVIFDLYKANQDR